MDPRRILVEPGAAGQRVDRFLAEHIASLTRAGVRSLCRAGAVRVAGRRLSPGDRVAAGQLIELQGDAVLSSAAVPDAAVALRVVFEDAHLVVVDKPAGQPSHPLRPGERATLASGLLARYPEMAEVGHSAREPGLLHRLDVDTSGLLICARDLATFQALLDMLRRGAIDKRYLALVTALPAVPARHRAWLLARGRRVRVQAQPFPGAREIETELLEASAFAGAHLLQLRVHNAARHQVRAHLAALGAPIAGDLLYGGPALPGLRRQFLHASALGFVHPHGGQRLEFSAPLPADLQIGAPTPDRAGS